jgi:hypothetical protein
MSSPGFSKEGASTAAAWLASGTKVVVPPPALTWAKRRTKNAQYQQH